MILEAAIGDIALVFNGKTPSKSEQRSAGRPVLKIKDVDDRENFIGTFDSYVDEEFWHRFKKKALKRGDFLILNAAHNAGYVGSKMYCATDEVVGAIPTGEWTVIRASSHCVVQEYLNHWLTLPMTAFKFRKLVKGIHLYPRDIADLRLPLPDPNEQRRVAAILDKASAIRRKRHQTLSEIDKLVPALFFGMFGDVKANARHFNKEPLGNLIRVRSGDFLPAKDMVTSGTHAVYGGNGINGRHSCYMFEEPKIVIGRVGVYCGAIHVTEPKSWVTDNALYVSEFRSDLDFDYLTWALRIADLNKRASQAAQPLISAGRINPVEIPIPPMELQLMFKERTGKLRDVRLRLRGLASDADALFASLSQRAFTDELRIRQAQPGPNS